MIPIRKYPRTKHIEGSRLQVGDDDIDQVPFEKLKGLHLVLEEKIDGANCAFSFDEDGALLLQSRGHYLIGGAREKHFDLFKLWAETHRYDLYETIGSRFIVYGEWLYAKHTVFYDALPHYFLEFDVFDREKDIYLDTPGRRKLLENLPVVSVPVLRSGKVQTLKEMTGLIGPSNYIREGHIERMCEYCNANGINAETAWNETDRSVLMEGIYIKHEERGEVLDRFKFVRSEFMQAIVSSGSHWLSRPIIPNQLSGSINDLFQPGKG